MPKNSTPEIIAEILKDDTITFTEKNKRIVNVLDDLKGSYAAKYFLEAMNLCYHKKIPTVLDALGWFLLELPSQAGREQLQSPECFSKLELNISNLVQRIDEISEKVYNIESDIRSLKPDVSNLEREFNSLKDDVRSIETRIERI